MLRRHLMPYRAELSLVNIRLITPLNNTSIGS
jgi:hypothetical protein